MTKRRGHMPWKFIVGLIILILFVVFIGLNLDYRTNVSLGFYTFENVPAFLIVIVSFLVGALVTLPVSVFSKLRKNAKKDKKQKLREKTEIQEPAAQDEKGKRNKRK
jgi:uncharacterized integral membrane protein